MIRDLLLAARIAARHSLKLKADDRDDALSRIAQAIAADADRILEANTRDVAAARDLTAAMQDRLRLDPRRVQDMVRAIEEVRAQPDPLGGRRAIGVGRSGVRVERKRVPLGVVAIVYEARPNVTAECAALTLKSGNAVVLRGGSEAAESNRAIAEAIHRALSASRVPPQAVQLVLDPSRDAVVELLGATGLVDLVIPRGGAGLMAMVDAHAKVPVIRHGQGICHVYVDEDADLEMAVAIAHNAKVQRPGVCNAMETLLVHQKRLHDVLSRLGPRLQASGVEVRADAASKAELAKAGVSTVLAKAEDFDTEFLDLIVAIKSVSGLDEAIEHIAEHGTHHTASIITQSDERARRFLDEVDASCVLWNASTRLNDGGELGLGAEMGISTSKMHAYGPMSATELTAEKLVVTGDGQIKT
jgi:glutamate-5-semialdehyde dehydrogenase